MRLNLTANAADGDALTSLSIKVNSISMLTQSLSGAHRASAVTVPLVICANQVEVSATSASGLRSLQRVAMVNRLPAQVGRVPSL